MSAVVACVGLAVLDRVFRVAALPSAPGKNFATSFHETVGGVAANASIAVARLGGAARMVGRVGDDPAGRAARRSLEAAGVDCAALGVGPGETPHSAVIVDAEGERMIVNRKDPALFDGAPDLDAARLGECRAILADLRWPAAAQAAFAAAPEGARRVLDFDQAPEEDATELLRRVDVAIFGADALRALIGGVDMQALETVSVRWGVPAVAVTVGSDGVRWLHDGARGLIAAHRVPVVDTLGAGDAFHGAAALALAEGASFEHALRFANAAAAIKVGRPSGPESAPTRAELDAFMKERAA